MKALWIAMLIAALAYTVARAPLVFAASDSDLRNRCETKRYAPACFELGIAEMKRKDAVSRKSAKKHLAMGCMIQTKRAKCTGRETKTVARAFMMSKDRIPATAAGATGRTSSSSTATSAQQPHVIKAPKISSSPKNKNYRAPPPASEPPPMPPPLPPAQPEPPPVPEYIPQPPAPAQPAWEPRPQECIPGDPSCAQNLQDAQGFDNSSK